MTQQMQSKQSLPAPTISATQAAIPTPVATSPTQANTAPKIIYILDSDLMDEEYLL